MQYGSFSANGREYIITNPRTPSPWINYIYNGRYFSTISNNGGGISYYKSPLHGRVTRYRINEVPPDRPGKYIYIKDCETGEIWSLTWQPVGKHADSYRVAHGFGYTRAESEINGIASEVLFFVPSDDDREIWKTILTNKTNRKRKLSVYGYVELALGHALVDLINQCDDQHFNRSYFDRKLNSVFSTKTYWVTQTKGTQQQENKEWDQWTFFTVNQPVKAYETVRERFLGLYRSESNPEAIENESLLSLDTDYGNVVNALQIDIELLPDESLPLIFSLGVIEKTQFELQKEQRLSKYTTLDEVEKSFQEIINQWNKYFSFTSVDTPDADTNLFLKYWLPYQAKVAFDIGRVASFYYWGIGRGFGFRDTSQDTIAVTISDPVKARERILLLSRQMQSNGKVYHHFHGDGQGEFTYHCDDPLWFILAVTDYIKETGDISLLSEVQPYIEAPKTGTILEHLMAVVNFAANNLGKHGLPVFGRGDWNDTLDYIGGDDGGESVWGAMFYAAMLNNLAQLLVFSNNTHLLKEVTSLRDKLHKSVDENCWDGEWYIRAIGDKNKRIGSHLNQYGKIFLNTQIWPALADFPDKERVKTALDSVSKYLDSAEGPKKCAPAWREIDPNIGLVTRCVWGKKENGAVFCHPTTWLIQAETILGRGNKAYQWFKKMLPNRIDSDIFVAEPYVYSQYITSNEHSSPGRASHSWQTGSAAWMYRVVYDYLLGVRATYQGLLIDPVLPDEWKTCRINRVFRGTLYEIEIINEHSVQKGVQQIFVDGAAISGNIISPRKAETCKIKVIMG